MKRFNASTFALLVLGLGTCLMLSLPALSQVAASRVAPGAPVAPSGDVPVARMNTSDNGTQVAEVGTLYTVPAGKRLVIETVSVRVVTASGHTVIGSIGTRIGGQTIPTQLVFVFQGNDGNQARYAATHSVRLYAEAGSNVTISTFRTDRNAVGSKTASFTGYLEPAG